MREMTEEELKLAAKRKPAGAAYLRRQYAERRKRQAEAEQKREAVQESEVKYTMPPTPGELLDAALLELDAVTDENFREQIQKARGLVAQANKWVGSHLMFAKEKDHPAAAFLRAMRANKGIPSDAYPKIITTPREELQRRQENEQKKIKEASDRALRASKGIPSDAYPKIITTPREELQRRQENEQKKMKGETENEDD